MVKIQVWVVLRLKNSRILGNISYISVWGSKLIVDSIHQFETHEVNHVKNSWIFFRAISLLQRRHCTVMECGAFFYDWHWFGNVFENIYVADQNYDSEVYKFYTLIWDPSIDMFGTLSFLDRDMFLHLGYLDLLIAVVQ